MDHLNIPTTRITRRDKERALTLHQRIELFTENEATLGGHLMALKWLGNAGSHDGDVDQEDVFLALEVLEHVLSELFEGRSQRISELASQIRERYATKS